MSLAPIFNPAWLDLTLAFRYGPSMSSLSGLIAYILYFPFKDRYTLSLSSTIATLMMTPGAFSADKLLIGHRVSIRKPMHIV